MEPSQKKLSASLNDFASVLVEEELEPIRLDIIRIENDLKDTIEEIQKSIPKKPLQDGNVSGSYRHEIIEEVNDIIKEMHEEIKNNIEQIKLSIIEEVNKKVLPLENAILELTKNADKNPHTVKENESLSNDKNFDSLKSSIDVLSSKVSKILETEFERKNEKISNSKNQTTKEHAKITTLLFLS
ncbi:MAG: hypothetical protein LBH98_04260 [Chitinispirillales bacterium]|jgi:hypothetical protein|nr:hypothetical protein [Chitinispirillales bacterium]